MSDVSGALQSDCTPELDTVQNADHSLSSQVQSTLGIHYLDGFEGEHKNVLLIWSRQIGVRSEYQRRLVISPL